MKDLFHKWIWHKDDKKIFDIDDAIKEIDEIKKWGEDIDALVKFVKKESHLFTDSESTAEILDLEKEFLSAYGSIHFIRHRLMQLIRQKTGLTF